VPDTIRPAADFGRQDGHLAHATTADLNPTTLRMSTKRGARRETQVPARRPSIVAGSLAAEVAASLEAGEQQRRDLTVAAIGVAAWLAEQGQPGRWDLLDVEAALPRMGFARQQDVDTFLLSLVALVGHAGFTEQLPLQDAGRILLHIRELASHPIVSNLAGQTAGQLRTLVK
jgi:hypothetical protein